MNSKVRGDTDVGTPGSRPGSGTRRLGLTAAAAVLIGGTLAPTGAIAAQTFKEGERAYLQQDFKTSHRILIRLARKGHARAQYLLGRQYQFGQGVNRDNVQAYYWYSRAEKNGHVEAGLFRHLLVSKWKMSKDDVAKAKQLLAGRTLVAAGSRKSVPDGSVKKPATRVAGPDNASTAAKPDKKPAPQAKPTPRGSDKTRRAARAAAKKVHSAKPAPKPRVAKPNVTRKPAKLKHPIVRARPTIRKRKPRSVASRYIPPRRVTPRRAKPRYPAPSANSGWVRRATPPPPPCRWCNDQPSYRAPVYRTDPWAHPHRRAVSPYHAVPRYVWRLPPWRRRIWLQRHRWRLANSPFYRRAWRAYLRYKYGRRHRRW